MTFAEWRERIAHMCNFGFRRNYVVRFPKETLTRDLVVSADDDTLHLTTELAEHWLEHMMPNRWRNITDRTPRQRAYTAFKFIVDTTVEDDVFVFCRLEDAILAEQQWCGKLLND